jgi:hypothetical protein
MLEYVMDRLLYDLGIYFELIAGHEWQQRYPTWVQAVEVLNHVNPGLNDPRDMEHLEEIRTILGIDEDSSLPSSPPACLTPCKFDILFIFLFC